MKTKSQTTLRAALLGVVFTAEMPPASRINQLAANPFTVSLLRTATQPHRTMRPGLTVRWSFMMVFVVWGALGWLTVTTRAADRTWTGAVNGYWSEPGNWEPTGAPQNGDHLYFGFLRDTNRVMVNDLTGLSVDLIAISNNEYVVSGNPLTINTNGQIEVSGVTNPIFSVSCTVALAEACTCFTVTNGYIDITGVITGTGPLTKTGPGVLYIGAIPAGNDSYSGDTIVNEGFLVLTGYPSYASVPGPLIIGGNAGTSATVLVRTSDSIVSGVVEVNANSVLNLNGYSQTLSELRLNDGGRVVTGAGVLGLTSGATVTVGSLNLLGSHAGSSIQGNLGLTPNSLPPVFNVSSYAPFAPFASQPELDVAATIFINGYQNPNLVPTGIKKDGTGVMRLDGTNTYQGITAINAGTLEVDGSQPASLVAVNGGTLRGTGDVGPVYLTSASATVAPGDSPGILTSGNFDAGGGSGTLQVELNSATLGSGYAQLNVHGSVDLSGVTLSGVLNFMPPTNQLSLAYLIINNDGTDPVIGTFNGLPQDATVVFGNEAFYVSYTAGDGNDVGLIPGGPVVRPRLNIERAAADSVRLLWRTNDSAFTLQSVTNLGQTNWSSVSPAPIIIGSNNVVTNAAGEGQQFYRLFKP